jgi:hypothetical protein
VLCFRAMKCPHCDVGNHEAFQRHQQFVQPKHAWFAYYQLCPECKNSIIRLEARVPTQPNQGLGTVVVEAFTAFPKNASARPLPAEVPNPYKQDFDEAVAVLSLSPKASAALSRRILQAILREKANTKKRDLADQIDEVIALGHLPTHILEGLDAVRNIGNFAAHAIKSTSTGEIVEVEPGEAEWNLDVLESLFDHSFVQPALTAKRKAALNEKLKDANKPQLK